MDASEVLSPHRLVLHQLHLQTSDLSPQSADLLTGLVLVHHHLVLDVTRSVGVLQSVQRLHEVTIRRTNAGDHYCLTETKNRAKITTHAIKRKNRGRRGKDPDKMHRTVRQLGSTDLFPPNESCRSRVSLESR